MSEVPLQPQQEHEEEASATVARTSQLEIPNPNLDRRQAQGGDTTRARRSKNWLTATGARGVIRCLTVFVFAWVGERADQGRLERVKKKAVRRLTRSTLHPQP